LVRTPISSHRADPAKVRVPKSSAAVKRPWLTAVGELVSGPATALWRPLRPSSLNVRS
jgi:hypothetical protein